MDPPNGLKVAKIIKINEKSRTKENILTIICFPKWSFKLLIQGSY